MLSSETKKNKNESDSQSQHSSLTYNSYLKVDELKKLQVCKSDPAHHDEILFIVIHQAYELWFKLILHELDTTMALIDAGKIRRSIYYLKRINEVFKLLVNQIHILETMSPMDFLGFRNKLNPASGFQSGQFREIEFAAGLKDKQMLEHFRGDSNAYESLLARFNSPSLADVFYQYLHRQGLDLLNNLGQSNLSEQLQSQETEKRLQEIRKIYEQSEKYEEAYALAEALLDLDELIGLWRVHHVTVVERIIGFKYGTGGSEGVGYLRSTLNKRCFPDLWKVRTFLESPQ